MGDPSVLLAPHADIVINRVHVLPIQVALRNISIALAYTGEWVPFVYDYNGRVLISVNVCNAWSKLKYHNIRVRPPKAPTPRTDRPNGSVAADASAIADITVKLLEDGGFTDTSRNDADIDAGAVSTWPASSFTAPAPSAHEYLSILHHLLPLIRKAQAEIAGEESTNPRC